LPQLLSDVLAGNKMAISFNNINELKECIELSVSLGYELLGNCSIEAYINAFRARGDVCLYIHETKISFLLRNIISYDECYKKTFTIRIKEAST